MAAAARASDGGGTKKTWAIIGASRGIGREFVEQLLAQGDEVYATVRGDTASYSAEHRDLCQVHNCDVTSETSINVRSPREDICQWFTRNLTWGSVEIR